MAASAASLGAPLATARNEVERIQRLHIVSSTLKVSLCFYLADRCRWRDIAQLGRARYANPPPPSSAVVNVEKWVNAFDQASVIHYV